MLVLNFMFLTLCLLYNTKKISANKKVRPVFGTDFMSKIFTVDQEVKTHILGMC